MSMSHHTSRLGLPLMINGQASKTVIHNEALLALDGLTHLVISDFATDVPPDTAEHPVIVGDDPEGVFAGHSGQLALPSKSGWRFHDVVTGMTALDLASGEIRVRAENGWESIATEMSERTAQFGINTDADALNRLSVKSDSVLFTTDDNASMPSGDLRVMLNRKSDTDVASIMFQTGYTGNFELGLTGDRIMRLKSSVEGSIFNTALSVDPQTGFVGVGVDQPTRALEVRRDNAANVSSIGIANPSVVSGSSAAVDIAAGDDYRVSLQQYESGSAYLLTSGAAMFYQVAGIGGSHLFYNDGAPLVAFRPSGIDASVPVRFPSFSKDSLPDASTSGPGATIYVTNASSGAGLATSDGLSWRMVRDETVVS